MARILYGVAGEGFGHSSRAHITGKMLIESGHEVLFAASNKSLEYLNRYFPGRVCKIHGLTFHYENSTVNLPKTFFSNFSQLPEMLEINNKTFNGAVKDFAPDVVITDFDPFTSNWACKNEVPCISIDHEHLMCKFEFDRPETGWFERLMSDTVTKIYLKDISAYIVLNFFNAHPLADNAHLAPPVIRDEAAKHKPTSEDDHVICYATTESCLDDFYRVFKKFPQQKFLLYGFGIEGVEGNCIFRQRNTEEFLRDLASCRGVIASGGFSLISECLHFKKRMLVKPIHNQVEQMINAYHIDRMGAGAYVDKIDENVLDNYLEWLKETPSFGHKDMLRPNNDAYFSILAGVLADVTGGKARLPKYERSVEL
ncbi:putative glycosyl transferase [Sedimentisphaera cyanobacteriorum]|uniref:Putative glycosyl transferase n=1 Tax=Sedimentisphaera cyanobacteriorum TaxID=1940790 RepID=A0A1Q2HSB6_9BACT|nr:glycosyltransferase family protein [Sedimentisphaera cyanobacteriorum]AQQ10156.1 putative glycosyl transferase [Sedimentisphaera cyanobacteriorum]